MWSSELCVAVEQVVLSRVAEEEYMKAIEDDVDKEFQRDEGMLTGTGEAALLVRTAKVEVGGLVEEEFMVVEEVVVASELTGTSRLGLLEFGVWGRRHQEDTGRAEFNVEVAGEQANTILECVTRGLNRFGEALSELEI